MINTLIVILFCLASIIVFFFSRMWGWIILAVPFAYLLSQAFFVKIIYKWKHIPEISTEANRLFQKYGHYYAMPFAGRDFSSASSAVGITGLIISIIGLFYQFWWGILLGVMSLWIGNRLGKFYNPSMFLELLSDNEKQAHEEIMFFLRKKLEQTPDEEEEKEDPFANISVDDIEREIDKLGQDVKKGLEDSLTNMLTEDLLVFKDKYKSNKRVVKMIDNILEARAKAKREF